MTHGAGIAGTAPILPAADADPAAGRRAVALWAAWLPLLWVLGLNVVLVPPLLLWLCWRCWPSGPAPNLVAAAWFVAGAGQLAASAWNSAQIGEGAAGLAGRATALNITGWVALGLAIAAGASHAMAGRDMVRATMRIGLTMVLASAACLALAKGLGAEGLDVPTPARILLGDRPMVNFYTMLSVSMAEEWLPGLPRLKLFFPWPTALGFAGVCVGLAAFLERDPRWRAAGLAGCLVAVVVSGSRNAFVVMPLGLAVLAAFRWRGTFLLALAAAALLAALGFAVAGVDPIALQSEAVDALKESRAGSSLARDTIYEYSWQGFLASPLFGQGWVGESIIWQEDIPIGSHSTLYGTLYTGGLAAFSCLALATLATLAALVRRALMPDGGTAAVGTAMTVALVAFSYGECAYSFVLPCFFVFTFVGGALAAPGEASP